MNPADTAHDEASTPQPHVMLLPGWRGSGPDHWQRHWSIGYGDEIVEQDDWEWPRRGDWMARLDTVVLQRAGGGLVMVAHSLGCHLLASWAAHSAHARCVKAALLVAPPDTERDDMAPQLFSWRPMTLERFTFPATLVASSNDPYCAMARSEALANAWNAQLVDAGACGHLNAESGLGAWPQGRALLDDLRRRIG